LIVADQARLLDIVGWLKLVRSLFFL